VGGLYTFGSPMVGNEAFYNNFSRSVPECWRMFNHQDAADYPPGFVPKTPGLMWVPTGRIDKPVHEVMEPHSADQKKRQEEREVMGIAFQETGADEMEVPLITLTPGQPVSAEVRECHRLASIGLTGFYCLVTVHRQQQIDDALFEYLWKKRRTIQHTKKSRR
jgi:hypothetical protein